MMAEYAEALKRNGINYDEAMERFGGNAALYERLALKFLDDAHFAALEQALAASATSQRRRRSWIPPAMRTRPSSPL